MENNHTTESKEQEEKNEKSQGKKHSFTISKTSKNHKRRKWYDQKNK